MIVILWSGNRKIGFLAGCVTKTWINIVFMHAITLNHFQLLSPTSVAVRTRTTNYKICISVPLWKRLLMILCATLVIQVVAMHCTQMEQCLLRGRSVLDSGNLWNSINFPFFCKPVKNIYLHTMCHIVCCLCMSSQQVESQANFPLIIHSSGDEFHARPFLTDIKTFPSPAIE